MTVHRDTLLHFAAKLPPQRARLVVEAIVAAEAETKDPLAAHRKAIATAWERDLHPISMALAAALHAGSPEAIGGLGHLLPGLLREVNGKPGFLAALGRALLAAFASGLAPESPLAAAELRVAAETVPTDALQQLRHREVFETDLGHAELRGLSQEFKSRIIFTARGTNAEFVQELKDVCDDILSGKINQATGRFRLLGKLKELGYDPAVGFPADLADIPPAEKGSLQDLSSQQRLDLMIETNVRMAQNFGRMVAGNQRYELREYPAWELVRLFHREVPRGKKRVEGVIVDDEPNGWPRRWQEAAESVQHEGVAERGMIARKDSPLWPALGAGAGGHQDTLGNPFPPFAFRSGMGWRAVPRAECLDLGLVEGEEIPAPMTGTLAPAESEVVKAYDRLSPELQAELKRELEALGV